MSTVPNPMSGGVDVDAIIRAAALAAHPVGSYYWSSSSTNPGTLFGGTWTQITGRFVLAAGGGYNVGATGGEASVTSGPSSAANTGSTTLGINQIPSHSHPLNTYWNVARATDYSQLDQTYVRCTAYKYTPIVNDGDKTLNAGGGGGHTHTMAHTHTVATLPPYIVAYCWRRTA